MVAIVWLERSRRAVVELQEAVYYRDIWEFIWIQAQANSLDRSRFLSHTGERQRFVLE